MRATGRARELTDQQSTAAGSGAAKVSSHGRGYAQGSSSVRRPPSLTKRYPPPLPPGGRMPPMSTSRSVRTLASHASALRKVGHDARAFRKASRRLGGGESLVARARIRPRLLERSPTPEPHQTAIAPAATRRQDAANEHQQKHANLGFACFCPQESRARRPSFP